MPETPKVSAGDTTTKSGRSSGWYVLLLAWIVFGAAFFALSKTMVKPANDITSDQLIEIAGRYSSFVGIGLGLVAYLVTGLVYLIIRLFRLKARRFVALVLTALGYSAYLVFGYDLVYRERRYAEVARVIITYLGKPMLFSAAIVCGLAVLGVLLTLLLKLLLKLKRSK